MTNMASPNRIKAVLSEKNITEKWLSEQIGKNRSTVSKWCTNKRQPKPDVLDEIAIVLGTNLETLLKPTPSNDTIDFIDLFAGIGGFHQALHSIGAKCVFASEWDKKARQSYEANYKKTSPQLFEKDCLCVSTR